MRSSLVRTGILLLVAAALAWCGCQQQPQSLVNFAHLASLCEDVTIAGNPCTIVHIYSDAPSYAWTDAAGEGISCVDDVARAAVLYIHAGGAAGHAANTNRIRRLLNFILLMQAEDGTFYNFLEKGMTINRDGPNSRKSFGFWAARGYWALAEGYAFFKERDPEFAMELQRAWQRCLPLLGILEQEYDKYEIIGKVSYPAWLLSGHAADATSEFLLGTVAWLSVRHDSLVAYHAAKLASGIAAMQVAADSGMPPSGIAGVGTEAIPAGQTLSNMGMYGAFYSWPGIWHAWGNAQLQALAGLTAATGESQWLPPAREGARFFVRLLAGNWLHEYDFNTGETRTFPQIAYDVRTTALGFLQLYHATGEEEYAILAGLAASWLTGNNVAGEPLYDAATGRCFDGIDRQGLNRNSGAESTIEALYTLVEIEKVPAAAAWLNARSLEKWGDSAWPPQQGLRRTFKSAHGTIILTCNAGSGDFSLQRHDH